MHKGNLVVPEGWNQTSPEQSRIDSARIEGWFTQTDGKVVVKLICVDTGKQIDAYPHWLEPMR